MTSPVSPMPPTSPTPPTSPSGPGWIRRRVPVDDVLAFLGRKTVPSHPLTYTHLFGGLTLFFFLVQVATGALLTIYYQPTPEGAHGSVESIITSVSFGWLIRSLHSWTSHLMVASMLVHLGFKFFQRAYAAPRELTWVTGVVLLLTVLAFAFTGYLLPWDTVGYFATQIGTEVSQTVPLLGPFITSLIRGGEYVDGTTLTRAFSLHVIVLPLAAIAIISVHVMLSHHSGPAIPASMTGRVGTPIRFYPDFLRRDAQAWLVGTCLILLFAVLWPPVLGTRAESLASAPAGIKPEWYFLPLYQVLKLVPGTILGMDSAAVVNGGVVVGVTLMLMLPFLDRGSPGGAASKAIRTTGAIGVVTAGALVVMAYAGTPGVADAGMNGNHPEFGMRVSIVVVGLFLFAIGIVLIRISSRWE